LEIVADGIDINSNSIHPATHHTTVPDSKDDPATVRDRVPSSAVAILREKTVTANASSELWDQFVGEFVTIDQAPLACSQFFKDGLDRVVLVREALSKAGGNHRAAAVALLQRMSNEEQQELFPELVQLARAVHGPVATVRAIIASLPRQWVLRRIDAEIERILEGQQYDDYWMFAELLAELDHERAVNLARRAADSDDPEIRELGSDMLASLD
jgi:hypothetical protein